MLLEIGEKQCICKNTADIDVKIDINFAILSSQRYWISKNIPSIYLTVSIKYVDIAYEAKPIIIIANVSKSITL